MPPFAPVRLVVLLGATAVCLAAGALVAPAASADDVPLPPGLASLPASSSASLHAVPLTDPLGRKLR